jgi:uncharacterized lipoprotein YbaY/heat shock protein HslJ
MNLIFNKTHVLLILFALVLNFGCATNPNSPDALITVSGTAAYRQRIAMPPDAVLSVRLEDVTRADTQSPVLAEFSEQFGDRQVPIAFSLQVANSDIQPGHRYNLRATITVAGKLHFTTTRSYPVLTQDAANNVDLLLDAVAVNELDKAVGSTSTLSLPATFSGILPCADCPGTEQTLTLRQDGLYRLRRVYQDKPEGSFAEAGGWKVTDKLLSLNNGAETILFAIIDSDTLRQLDQSGQLISSSANLDLRRSSERNLIGDSAEWRGTFQYLADAATFTECASGLHWPVAMTADYLSAERNYTRSSVTPGSPLWVTFNGQLAKMPGMEGQPVEQMLIEKFKSSQSDKNCLSVVSESPKSIAELTNTLWKLISLGDQPIANPPSPQRQIHMTLANGGSRVSGFSGCNRFTGSFKQTGSELHFSQMAGTMMACLSPDMELESQVLKLLNDTTHYRIEGEQLLLLMGDKVMARFESLYLR